LLDDVKTTGSTLNECAKMLKIYGAKAVYCAAVAITNYNHKKTISL
jgi:predicted amidophosphoribosyltransferase